MTIGSEASRSRERRRNGVCCQSIINAYIIYRGFRHNLQVRFDIKDVICPPKFCFSQATKHRSVGATNLNRASSRSHAVLTIEATMVDAVANTSMYPSFGDHGPTNPLPALTGKINLVDLAGSENNKVGRVPISSFFYSLKLLLVDRK